MPDIDLDLPDNRREEVLNYLHHHYGHERVAQIITFGSLGTKQVLRDVSRVFNLPKYQVDSLSQVIDRVKGPTRPSPTCWKAPSRSKTWPAIPSSWPACWKWRPS